MGTGAGADSGLFGAFWAEVDAGGGVLVGGEAPPFCPPEEGEGAGKGVTGKLGGNDGTGTCAGPLGCEGDGEDEGC